MNLRSLLLYFCCIYLLLPFPGQAQDTTSQASEKMMAIQKEAENQRLNRISYPEHLVENQVWQPPGAEKEEEEAIPGWTYAIVLVLLASLGLLTLKMNLRQRNKAQKQKMIGDKLASLRNQPFSPTEIITAKEIGQQVCEGVSLKVLKQISIQKVMDPQTSTFQLAFAREDGQESAELSAALSTSITGKAGTSLQVRQGPDHSFQYLLTFPLQHADEPPLAGAADIAGSDSGAPSLRVVDQDFLIRAHQTVTQNLGDATFNAEAFREEMGMSKTHFYRKLQELTNQSPGQYIRQMRLKKAHELLLAGTGNVSEIAYKVGFNNLSYFSRCFRNEFGILPSEVA